MAAVHTAVGPRDVHEDWEHHGDSVGPPTEESLTQNRGHELLLHRIEALDSPARTIQDSNGERPTSALGCLVVVEAPRRLLVGGPVIIGPRRAEVAGGVQQSRATSSMFQDQSKAIARDRRLCPIRDGLINLSFRWPPKRHLRFPKGRDQPPRPSDARALRDKARVAAADTPGAGQGDAFVPGSIRDSGLSIAQRTRDGAPSAF